jgi:hypothetical protein
MYRQSLSVEIPGIYPRMRSVWIILTKHRVHAASAHLILTPSQQCLSGFPLTATVTSSYCMYNKADGASPAHTKRIYVCPDHIGWLCTEACVNLSLGTLVMMFVGWFAGLYTITFCTYRALSCVSSRRDWSGREEAQRISVTTWTPVAAPTSGAGKQACLGAGSVDRPITLWGFRCMSSAQ